MPLRILITDDSATNRLLFSTVMTRLGHQADTASSGREALALFREQRYDLVFLDLNMPVMNGVKTAEEIQKQNPRHIPVYAISGFPDPETESLFSAAGIRRCIIKPLDREKLDSVIRECRFAQEPPPEAPTSTVPHKLMGTYAHELRSRAGACLRYLEERNMTGLLREAHTIRALGQMLKTPEVEAAAANLETACAARQPDALVKITHDACMKTAGMIEKTLSIPSTA